jgi:putative phosphoesterase
MKIAVISDIHENTHNLVLFLEQIEKLNIEQILCLGDLINAGVGKMLAYAPVPTMMVWGNNDGDTVANTKASLAEGSKLTVGFSTFDIVEFGGRTIFMTHYPMLAQPMAKSGDFDAVFFGHDHVKSMEKVGECLVLNPGEISAHKTSEASFAVYDTETNDAEIITLDGIKTLKSELVTAHHKKVGFTYNNTAAHKR